MADGPVEWSALPVGVLLAALLPGALVKGYQRRWYARSGYTLVALGARLRTAALLIAGEATVAICVVAHLSAATRAVPQWVALAAAGALLLGGTAACWRRRVPEQSTIDPSALLLRPPVGRNRMLGCGVDSTWPQRPRVR